MAGISKDRDAPKGKLKRTGLEEIPEKSEGGVLEQEFTTNETEKKVAEGNENQTCEERIFPSENGTRQVEKWK